MKIVQPNCKQLRNAQRGITTVTVAVMLLIILAVALLFAASVGMFEQRTTTTEIRSRLVSNSAESTLNLALEYLKVNGSKITSTGTGGWMNSASTVKWAACSDSVTTCLAEENASRRAASWYIASLPITGALATADASLVTQVNLSGSATTAVTSTVGALLCQFDGDDAGAENPCALNPSTSGPLVITLVTTTQIAGESAESEVKTVLATYRTIGGGAKAPLIATGTVVGLGSMEIVAAPSGAAVGGKGSGPISIWSPCPVDIEAGTYVSTDPLCSATGSGIGSVATCQLNEYVTPNYSASIVDIESYLLDTTSGCASASNVCECPSSTTSAGFLSGHTGSVTKEGIDILDIDGNTGELGDITYFPREPYDDATDNFDDSIFEVTFKKDVVVEGETSVKTTGCTPDCAVAALEDMKPIKVTSCAGIPASTGGFYWVGYDTPNVAEGNCNLPAQVGTPTDPVMIVIEGGSGDVTLQGNSKVFGMIFVRSSTNAATLRGGSSSWFIYGALVVEGRADMTGLNLVYSEQVINRINSSPSFNRFAVVPGSWLDARTRF